MLALTIPKTKKLLNLNYLILKKASALVPDLRISQHYLIQLKWLEIISYTAML